MRKMRADRQAMIDAVGAGMREVSGLSVLYSHAMASELGINSTDLECLDLVIFGGEMTAGALAVQAGLTTGAMTTVIDRLERTGFVERRRDDGDRRKVLVVATAASKRRRKPLGAKMQKAMNKVLGGFEDAELAFLQRALGEMCGAAREVVASTRRSETSPRGPAKPKKSQRRP
jgi:DNA-binding MarR family transcriptional regulator